MYISTLLNHSTAPAMEDMEFDCATWSIIKLARNKSLQFGAIYRSPSSTVENNQNILSLLRAAASANCQFLNVCGDFNLPLIDWNVSRSLESENAYSSQFVELVEGLSLYQHARESTRFRGVQNSCLDLILTNEECMIEEIRELPPIGKSDHICQQWDLIVSEAMYRNTVLLRPNFKQARWSDLKSDLRDYENAAEDRPSLMFDKFVTMVNDAKTKHIPMCKPRSNRHRLPWMRSPRIKRQGTGQWRAWKKYKQTKSAQDYDAYKMERNRLCHMIRTAKMKYESRLIGDMKHNPNLYHGHCRRTLKTKQGVTNVVDGNGILTVTQETAEALNGYYQSVFTIDEGLAPPVFDQRTEEKIVDVSLTTESIEEKLQELNPNKAAGPDGVESRLLKECAEEVAPILQQIFRKS